MKIKMLIRGISFLSLAAIVGCAAPNHVVVNQTVGPSVRRASGTRTDGALVVYTALEVPNAVASDNPTHSGYKIYTRDGKLLRSVDNRTGSFYRDPVTVDLPAGTYSVKGRATNSGEVMVPVVVDTGKTTVVDLDGTTLPQSRPTGQGRWVRLPDGKVIGARAD